MLQRLVGDKVLRMIYLVFAIFLVYKCVANG